MNTKIEIDLGLTKVSDGALAMLEGATRAASLPANLFCRLLDALAEEHLRRFGGRSGTTVALKMPTETLDTDELWHSVRMLGNWLSNSDDASHGDPDLDAVSEVIARMWIGMRGALNEVTNAANGETRRETGN